MRKVWQRKMAQKKEELLNSLIDSIASINTAESEIYDYVGTLEAVQDKIRDIEHYLEDHYITRSGAIKLVEILQELRIERRQIKQMWELWNVYGIGRDKLKQKDYRERLIADLRKKDTDLQTKYNYRQFSEEYLDALNEDKPLPRRRKPLNSSYNDNIEEEGELYYGEQAEDGAKEI